MTRVTDEHFKTLLSRFDEFQASLNHVDKAPVRVFSPLKQWQLDELHLIREVSKDLQNKKIEENIRKQEDAAAAAEEAKKKIQESAKEVEKEDA